MATKNINLGTVPVSRGEFNSTTIYYKDNIVQYKRGSYQVVSESPIVGVPPINDEDIVNNGWIIFAGTLSEASLIKSNTQYLSGNNVQENLNSAAEKLKELKSEAVYDVSACNNSTTFESLSALLSDENLSTLIPSEIRYGGMSIRFIQSSDNKYVQYRLMSVDWSINSDDWAIFDEGVYVDNPEFIYVKTDAEGKILLAIKANGNVYYGEGIPSQIQEKLDNKADFAEVTEIAANKVNKEEGKSLINVEYASSKSAIENPEFIEVTTDLEDKVLEGIQEDGTKVIGGNLNVRGSAKILGNMEISGISYKVIENQEYIAAWVDLNDKVIFGIKTDGKTYIGDAYFLNDIDDIKVFLTNITDKNIDWDALSSITAIENSEYLEAKTDSEGKLLAGRTPNGAAFEKVGFTTPKVSINGTTIENIEDPEERTDILIDTEGKIISYRDNNGVKYEKVGINSAAVNTDNLKLSDKGMNDFQKALIESGFNPKSVIDWSDEISLKLPSPKCAKINFIISHNYSDKQIQNFKENKNWPNILLPTTKITDLKCTAEYWDMLGNYFKKAVVLNAQGNSSMIYKIKNLTLDLDDGSEISFGGWVMQDSFHMKFYYQDFFKVYCVAAYRIGEELIKYKNCRSNRNKVGKNDSHWNFGATTDILENNVVSGALCHPDGFGVEVYINGEYHGLFMMQLKKHRKNYDMNKNNYEEVLIDNVIFSTQSVWTTFEIKNPKTLICMDGTKYDDDTPKELIDSSSEFYDSTNKDHKNTVKTKNEILRFCSAMSTITSSGNSKEKFLEFFDKDMLEVYFILYELLYGYDNAGGNWVWSCFNKIWAPNFYDLDTTCGKTSSGTIIQTSSTKTFLEPNVETHPLGFVWANYKSEIVSLWNELRNKKIIDVDNLILFYERIMRDIGISAYERQYKKYPTLPSYRNSTFDDEVVLSDTTKVKRSDYWEVIREVQDWNQDPTDFDNAKMYVIGDTCKVYVGHYNHINFRCKQNIPEAGLSPMTFNIYIDKANGESVSGGFYDSLNRIKKWFDERITFLDTKFVN